MSATMMAQEDSAAATLFAQLIETLHDESDALIANDAASLADAVSRKGHLLRLLAPQANALRSLRRSGDGELERFAREAAQLNAFNADLLGARQGVVRGRIEALLAAAGQGAVYGVDGATPISSSPRHAMSRA